MKKSENFDTNYKEAIIKNTNEYSSDIIFIGFYFPFLQIKDFIELLETIKLQWSKITTLVGCPFPAVFAEMTSEYELIDIVCWGDRVKVSVQVVGSIIDHKDYSEIPNLFF